MKLIIDTVFQKFSMYYKRAVKDKLILKPISWALYQTWKYFDDHEKPRADKE